MCYVDMYYFVARKDCPNDNTDFSGLIAAGFSGSPTNMGGSTLSATTYGATLFQCQEFCQYFKIYRKTSTLLSPDGVMEAHCKISKNFLFNREAVGGILGRKGITSGVIIFHYGIPSDADGLPVASTISYNITKTYTLSSNRSGLVDSGTTLLTV